MSQPVAASDAISAAAAAPVAAVGAPGGAPLEFDVNAVAALPVPDGHKRCAQCSTPQPRDAFSNTQLRRKGKAVCRTCTAREEALASLNPLSIAAGLGASVSAAASSSVEDSNNSECVFCQESLWLEPMDLLRGQEMLLAPECDHLAHQRCFTKYFHCRFRDADVIQLDARGDCFVPHGCPLCRYDVRSSRMWGAERYWEAPRNWERHIIATLQLTRPKPKRSDGGIPYSQVLEGAVEHVRAAARGVKGRLISAAELAACAGMGILELYKYAALALSVCSHRWVKHEAPAAAGAAAPVRSSFSYPKCGRYELIRPSADENDWTLWLHEWGVAPDRRCASCRKATAHLLPCEGPCSVTRRVYYCSKDCVDWHRDAHALQCSPQYPGAAHWRAEEIKHSKSVKHRPYWA